MTQIAKAAAARWQTYEKAKTELFKDDNKCNLANKALQVLNEQRTNMGQQPYQCNYAFVIKIAEKLQVLEQQAVKLAAQWTSTRTKYTHMNDLVRQG
jgi:hypothetical protein